MNDPSTCYTKKFKYYSITVCLLSRFYSLEKPRYPSCLEYFEFTLLQITLQSQSLYVKGSAIPIPNSSVLFNLCYYFIINRSNF
jgi:hypothetical protein